MTTLKLKGGVESNITKIYLLEILLGITFFAPTMMILMESKGLSLSEIFYIHMGFVLSMALFEIPTGYFADVYGRKTSIVWGAILELLAIGLFAFASSFILFLIVEILMGLSLALYSGSISSLVYESLKEQNRENEYMKVWGNINSYAFYTMGISAVMGSFIADRFGLSFPVYLNIPFFVWSLLIAISLKEPKREKIEAKKEYLKVFIGDIQNTFYSSRVLQFIVLYSALVYIFNQSIFISYQNYYKEIGIDLAYFGLIHGFFQIVASLSSKYAYKIEKSLGIKNILILLPFIEALSYILMGTIIGTWSFLFIVIQQFIRGFREVVVSSYINKLIDSKQRATILSVNSFISKLMITPMLLIWGFTLKYFSLTQTLLILGIVALIMAVGIFILIKGIENDKRTNRFGSI
jgi:MFS family permease